MGKSENQNFEGADFTYVDTPDGLIRLIEQAGGEACERCAIDTEADSLHCYEEKLCLIQFAAADQFAVIDPLAFDDLEPLIEFLDSTEVWLHGADFDMRMLRRTFDRIPNVVYDTQTAARLLGARKFGLANLVEDQFGVVLPKGSQKADWGKRPLTRKMIDYAVNDVRYLLSLATTLRAPSDRAADKDSSGVFADESIVKEVIVAPETGETNFNLEELLDDSA